jgi:hypothetical protein
LKGYLGIFAVFTFRFSGLALVLCRKWRLKTFIHKRPRLEKFGAPRGFTDRIGCHETIAPPDMSLARVLASVKQAFLTFFNPDYF